MKKILVLCSVLCLISVFSCSGIDGGGPAVKKIHGTAATGAYMPDGSIVQIRPAPVPTGQTILVGTTPGGYESWMPEENPADLIVGAVTGNEGAYSVDVSGTVGPYLIRVQDPVSLKWYYSFADELTETANVNPYTDWMVRAYYYGRWFVLIDDSFDSGVFSKFADGLPFFFFKTSYGFDGINVYWLNMPAPMPDVAGMTRNMKELQYVVNLRWGVEIGDILTRDWVVGSSYDSILDGSTLDAAYISLALADCFFADAMMDHGAAFYDTAAGTLHVDLWSPFNYCRIDWPDGTGFADAVPVETIDGLNHYTKTAPYTVKNPKIAFRIGNEPFTASAPGSVFNITTFDQ